MGEGQHSEDYELSASPQSVKLANVNGRRWAFLKRAWRIRRPDGDVYLTRWRLIQTPWFGVYLHRFDAPDPDAHLHDHPWNFTSFVLKGGYMEWVPHPSSPGTLCRFHGPQSNRGARYWRQTWRLKLRNRVSQHSAEDRHSVKTLFRVPTWTLFFVGARQREWGFWVDEQWVPWRTYLGMEDAA